MLAWIALFCLLAGLGLLAALCVIDLRVRLLPDRLVLPFALAGVAFHILMNAAYLSPAAMVGGALIGFGSLYLIRAAANRFYGMDALGLGDVKLMGAAGLWLGPDMITVALMTGALAGLAHGLAYALWQAARTGDKIELGALQIPAGPGFAVGIVAAGAWLLRDFPALLGAG